MFRLLFVLVALYGLLFVFGRAAITWSHTPAAALVVNSPDDTDDGACDAANCTLREAMRAANAAPDADTITFALPVSTTITLNEIDPLYITHTLTIDGSAVPNLTIDANGGDGPFFIFGSTTVTLTALTVTNSYDFRGAIFNQGTLTIRQSTVNDNRRGIENEGTLIVMDSVIRDNWGADGGCSGIFSEGPLTISHSLISGNTVTDSSTVGAGICSISGTATIDNSIISDNQAAGSTASGGGIYISGGTLTMNNSTVRNNFATGSAGGGGGISIAAGTVTINNSTIHGNQISGTGVRGGGIHLGSGTLIVNNSTLSDNIAADAGGGGAVQGGGIDILTGTVTINNSTISGNQATGVGARGGGIYSLLGTITVGNSTLSDNIADLGGGVYIDTDSTLHFNNTIIANSTANEACANAGTMGTNVNNLVEDGSCAALFSGDPLLAPLANNGGPTATHALLPGSPAVDAGDNTACLATDQRGFPRPIDGDENGSAICDIGAFERYPYAHYLPLIIKSE
jgi:CSLREA domain-containing protein